jgi:MraZ protein
MVGFLSSYERRIDKKGRVLLPPSFRQQLARENYDGVHCYPAVGMSAIDAGGQILLDEIGRHLGRFESFTREHDFLSTAFFGDSHHITIDPEGRVVFPDALLSYAGITEDLVLAGQGYKFQIWEPEQYRAHQAEARQRLMALREGAAAGEGRS